MPELLEYKCPCCDGKIQFDSTSQQMKCPYCDAKFNPEALKEYDENSLQEPTENAHWEDFSSDTINDDESEGINVYSCESCGGEIVGDETLASTKCPFCDSPVIIKKQFAGELKPDYVIPFKLDKKAAKESFYKHLKGKVFLPKTFKDENHIDEIKGLYVPFWLFDCNSNAAINYRATNVRMWSDSKYEYTETSVYNVFRSGEVDFENVPVDSSKKIDNDMTESIEPFNLNEAVDFQMAYLSGYIADKYDVSSDESIERANQRIKKSTEDVFLQTIHGYTTVVPERTSINISNGKARYALLPIWILNTTWKNEKYMFIMNGQTGKFAGDLPIDKVLFIKWFLVIFIISTLVVYGIEWLLRICGIL